jgi:hypothetical protein
MEVSEMSNTITLDQYKQGYRRVRRKEEKRGFKIHCIVYVCVNAVLLAVNLIFVREFLWFPFPLVGWGIGLSMHYIFGIRRLDQNIAKEEEEIAEASAGGNG